MSYDFEIFEVDVPPPCECGRKHLRASIDLGSPTYNFGDIFRLASGNLFAQSKEMTIPEARAMFGSMHDRLLRAMSSPIGDRERLAFVILEPSNGWGSLESAWRDIWRTLTALNKVLAAGGMRVVEWEPLARDNEVDGEGDDRPQRFVPVENLRFRA